jgi:hypothetical protein
MKLTDERITEIAVDGLGMIACKHCTFTELGYGLDNKELIAFARAIAAEQRKIDAEICNRFRNYHAYRCAEAILKECES